MRIGLAVQQGTYFTERHGSIASRALAPVRGAYNLLSRSLSAWRGGSEQGFGGTLSSAWAGHTLLHSGGGQGGPLSTGFSPHGDVNSARIGLGPHGALGEHGTAMVGAAVGAAAGYYAGGFLGNRPRAATLGAVAGHALGSMVGAESVPGAFHNETGIHHDPGAIAHTEPVGPGVHAQFQTMQRNLVHTEMGHGTYSFRPDLVRSQNCGSAATSQMGAFLQTATRHNTVMAQLQGAIAHAGGVATPTAIRNAVAAGAAPAPSPNQALEAASLAHLTTTTTLLHQSILQDRQQRVGNQGHITQIMRAVNPATGVQRATHGQL